ncbi:MAG: hypothetical protein FD135_3160 [Comamonadaceae bacterium]|nr:MAG: hypothetical protein FD135_3160 [Comamonadaceae bacterium]
MPSKRSGFNLDSSVGRTRVGCQERVWVDATTLKAPAFEEEQRPQARFWRLNRVRSAVTQKVKGISAQKVNVHADLLKKMSGQLRNPG